MIFHGDPVNIPTVSLGTFMCDKMQQFGDRIALIDSTTNRSLTFRQVVSQVRRVARALSSLGFKQGDVLCMFCPNVLEYPIVYYAVASLGGVFQATNPGYNSRELQHTFDLCKSKYVLTIPQLLPTVRGTNTRAKIIVLGKADGCISFVTLLDKKFSDAPVIEPPIDPKNDVAAILFSSGTTGKPKAVQCTHYSLVAVIMQLLATGNFGSDDTYLSILPYFHIYGLGPLLTGGLVTGATNVVMLRFEPQEYLNNISKHKVTINHVVPPVLVVLSRQATLSQYDLSSVSRVVCGAAPLSRDVEAKILKLFGIKHITQGYGLTECTTVYVVPANNTKFGSVGKILPGAKCKIVDTETRLALPTNKDGEVYIHSPALMKGYLSNPGATAAIFDKDGWLMTGDIGHVDEDGFLFIVDRIKELIKYKGFQVAPAELEDILLSHADVADVGVIGVPDVEAGELPKAFVVRKTGSGVSEKQLQDFVAGKVSGTKRLRGGVTFLPEIPKSPSGKILRRVLRDRENQTSKL